VAPTVQVRTEEFFGFGKFSDDDATVPEESDIMSKKNKRNRPTNRNRGGQMLPSQSTHHRPYQECDAFPTHILVGGERDPLIQLFQHQSNDRESYRELTLNRTSKTAIESVVRGMTNAALARGVQAFSGAYELVFSPHVAKGLQDGTLILVKSRAVDGGVRAIARGATDPKFVECGTLVTAGINPALVATFVWQALAIITAQKFLVDIDKRLAHLEREVQAIREWLENERTGKLLGNLECLRSIATHLMTSTVSALKSQCLAA
jgi:hypothetical protein